MSFWEGIDTLDFQEHHMLNMIKLNFMELLKFLYHIIIKLIRLRQWTASYMEPRALKPRSISTKIVTGIAISHLFSRDLWVWWHVGKYYSSETSTLITTTFYNTFLSIFVMLSLLLLNLLPGKIWVVCIWAQIPRKTSGYHDICSSHVLQVVNNVLY